MIRNIEVAFYERNYQHLTGLELIDREACSKRVEPKVIAYMQEQKLQILKLLLKGCHDGRRKKVGKPYAERKVSLSDLAVLKSHHLGVPRLIRSHENAKEK